MTFSILIITPYDISAKLLTELQKAPEYVIYNNQDDATILTEQTAKEMNEKHVSDSEEPFFKTGQKIYDYITSYKEGIKKCSNDIILTLDHTDEIINFDVEKIKDYISKGYNYFDHYTYSDVKTLKSTFMSHSITEYKKMILPEDILKIKSSGEILPSSNCYKLGKYFLEQKRYLSAIKTFKEFENLITVEDLEDNIILSQCCCLKALAYERIDNLDEAILEYMKAFKLYSFRRRPLIHLGYIYEGLGSKNKDKDAYQKAYLYAKMSLLIPEPVIIFEENPDTYGYQPYEILYRAASNSGRFEESKLYYIQALKMNPAANWIRVHADFFKVNILEVLEIKKDVIEIPEKIPIITIAILCKDKAHLLDLYLKCIYNLIYPKKLIHLYIRTNDNKDNTIQILKNWINIVKDDYLKIYYDDTNISEKLKQWKAHEWNPTRFSILGKIREESIQYAIENNTDYFIADCDNFLKSYTLLDLVKSEKLVIGPMLRAIEPKNKLTGESTLYYANMHNVADEKGYYKENEEYYKILYRENPKIYPVDIIHCTYYIQNSILKLCKYVDDTNDYEYVIFGRTLKKLGIQQYIDNRKNYGFLTFADDKQTFDEYVYTEVKLSLLDL